MVDHKELSEKRLNAFLRAKKHTRRVVALRRVLPVLAVICVGVYFIQTDFSVAYKNMKASVDAIKLTKNELKMINPRLEGHDKKSGSYLILADFATRKSGEPDVIYLDTINAKLDRPKNGTLRLTAEAGRYATKKEILHIERNVKINGQDGLFAQLERATVNMKQQVISSDRPVYFERFGSTIRAETLDVRTQEKVMTFRGRVKVKLIKAPEKKTGAVSAP